jgi:hypothetical protein
VRKGEVLFVLTDNADAGTRMIVAPVSGRFMNTIPGNRMVSSGMLLGTIEPLGKTGFYRQALRV